MLKTQVLICGAGPTGLTAALELNRFGIDFIIIDKKSGPVVSSNALGMQARTLELFELHDISSKLTNTGKITKDIVLNFKNKTAALDISNMGKTLSKYPYLLFIPQNLTEQILINTLTDNCIKINWKTELIDLNQKANMVLCKLSSEEIIEAKYVIGADGAHSKVRTLNNIPFEGGDYENKFLLGDVVLEEQNMKGSVEAFPTGKGISAFFPFSENYYRFITIIPPHLEDDDLTENKIEEILHYNSGKKFDIKNIKWHSKFYLHHKAAASFRKESCFLAGDAGHIHSPAGGQGMNTGIGDAFNLCWKLAYVLRGSIKEELLDTYNEERLPFAKWLLKYTDRGFNIAVSNKAIFKWMRLKLFPLILPHLVRSKYIMKRFFKRVSQIWISYSGSSFTYKGNHSGERMPLFEIKSKGKLINNYELMRNSCFNLFVFNPTEIKELNSCIAIHNISLNLLSKNLQKRWRNKLVLVRPDTYICYEGLYNYSFEKYIKNIFT